MFEDRRKHGDRRLTQDRLNIPSAGCRRHRDRRKALRQYHAQPWWLETNYAEELQPPLLHDAAEDSPD